ncbi:helicase C-terminal domain-containing protein [bacterium]|nr:helicase C-terminal domain-containing protein [bacterium]
MKLKSILKTLSVEQLQGVQEHWGIAPADLEVADSEQEKQDILINNLYQRLQNRNAWETATESLSERERNLINFLTIHGGDLEEEEVLRRFFEGDRKTMTETIDSLAQRGIVFNDEVPVTQPLNLVGIPEPFLRYIDLPSFWEGYLGHFLKELSNNELKHIATQGLRLHPESANKNYLIHIIRQALLDPKFLRRYLDRLTDGQRSVFQSLASRKGVSVYRDLLELNVQRRYDHSRGDSIHWLLNTSGLVFTAVPGGNKYNNLLMIPRDIMYIISNHFQSDTRTFKELDSVTVVEKEKKPTAIMDNSNTLLRDIVVFCNYVDRYPVRVLATGGIGKNDLKKIMPLLSRFKSLKYAEFLSLFLIQKKFLASTGESYRVSHTFLEWLENSQNAFQDIFSWWLTTTGWNEEFVEGNTVHIEPAPTGLVSIVAFRRVVLDVLTEMPRDRWCVEDGFYEEVLPRIQQDIPRRNEPLSYDKHTRSNELVIESIMAECLHWLGILAIGLKNEKDADLVGMRLGDGKTMKARGGSRGRPRKQKQLQYTFRFTDLGRFIFSRPMDRWDNLFDKEHPNEVLPLRYDVDSFIVQPTHEVIVPPDLELRTFYHLNEIGHVKSIDVMSLLTITKSSIREGLDRGLSGDEIQEFLKKHSRTPIPDSLTILVRECSEKHGEVNMGYAGGFIIMDDEVLLTQIRANRRISPSIKNIYDERVVLLNTDVDLKKVARELQKVGFMPRLESEHVHVREDERFNLSLTREDMVKLIASLRFTLDVAKNEKGRQVADERLSPLLERLKIDPRAFAALNDLADPLVSTWKKAVETATETRVSNVKREYKKQISHLVTTSVPTGPSKYNFSGPNPAEQASDIRRMLDFAIENEFEVEIHYIKANRDEVDELIAPESLERDRLYAHCRTRDAYSVYRVDRIMESKLV